MKQFYHKLKQNDNLKMQTHFVFFDTETHIKGTYVDGTQTLKLGWAKYWNRESNAEEWLYFEKPKTFWDWIEDLQIKDLIIYAHNSDFDVKQVDGYNELLLKRKYSHKATYVKGSVYIFEVHKKRIINNKETTTKIRIWDSCNYLPYSLEKIGESIGYPKMPTPDFETVDKQYLTTYCKNDVEVLHQFIKKVIEFLTKYNLTRLKSTGSSLAMNSFRHGFYDEINNPIYIHAHPKATRLERESYKGGITECYHLGQYRKKAYKVDVNSMYSNSMMEKSPTQLIYYRENEPYLKSDLLKHLNKFHCIAECTFTLPDKYSLILNKIALKYDENQTPTHTSKCIFVRGKQTACLNNPEIEFILKHGEIHTVRRLSMYKQAHLFSKYVKFFYGKKAEYKNVNPAFCEIAKLFQNKLYGKFGQKASEYKLLSKTAHFEVSNKIIYTPEHEHIHLMHFGNKLYRITKTDDNALDSFVAIASAITSHARMHLIKLILQAGEKHVFYSDTDSLIVDEIGYQRLQNELHQTELGKLKLEGECDNFEIIKPKHYVFDGELKVKGVKKNAIILLDNDKELCVMQNSFERFNGMMRNNNLSTQKTTMTVKKINKIYDKGKVKQGEIIRYTESEIQNLNQVIQPKHKSARGEKFPLLHN